ncbi:Slp family lipoprotein [Erwinia tasmaniensis]|uniref:Outer membrane protein n=1 Tax=Erwinia tasmaniensis (strain DSM 17950 / CFBP 7177 / CIP 109463 / NCPPB 4357 / Et1/99) TaxID=465817 RepID=B2VJ39_ERWT9|nr:Slp family lipoprotein [Erwinia tasmaniensis]CAO96578.1 Putative outer membrane protein [Erwinia tasmaniensis Et1/99]
MRTTKFWQFSGLLFVSLLLSGCISVPDAIKGTSATPQQDLVRVLNAPQLYIGQESRFGGKVIKVVNSNGKTRLEIAAMPLDEGATPILGASSIGRIYADVMGFIDPVDFNDQMVTVVGPISGVEKGKIGEAQYSFLVVNVTGYQRWHRSQQIIAPAPIDPWIWYGPGNGHHRGGYWGPAPWGYNPGPARVQTILTE